MVLSILMKKKIVFSGKKSVPSSRQEWNYDTLFETKMFEIDTLFAGLGLT